jgi:putative (di)nucleoside polyphosphate hydrolase
LPKLIVPFKRDLYEAVLAAFRPRLGADQTG